MTADLGWGDSRPDDVYWDRYPFKSYSELFPNLKNGTFRTDWASIQAISYRPPRPTILATESQLATLQRHYPLSDPSEPPWDEIKADLIAGGIAVDTILGLMAGDAVLLLARVSKPINPKGFSAYQWSEMRNLWKMTGPIFDRWLNATSPGELDPLLKNRDWRAELPYMKWTESGGILLGLDENGNHCLRCKDISQIPEGVRQYLTTSFCISGGVRVHEYYLPYNAPPLADYMRAKDHSSRAKMHEDKLRIDELHNQIADPENVEPIPIAILRQRPGLAEWLNGENDEYRPSMMELRVLKPAFVERRRRLRESALSSVREAPKPIAKSETAKRRRSVDANTEARDHWIYEECCRHVAYDTIALKLQKMPQEWDRIESKQGIRAAAVRYAKRHDLSPIPERQE